MSNQRKIFFIDRALDALASHADKCSLCPRMCRTDRRKQGRGICATGPAAGVSHALLHFGEEPVLSGRMEESGPKARGSGTIFFSGCNLKCVFCQNYQLSWQNEGRPATDEGLAGMMLDLERRGALNINFVSPTHILLPILRALRIAVDRGLGIPLVYNTNGYERAEIIGLLEGIIDVYLPDIKYISPRLSERYSAASDYFEYAGPSVQEMSVQQPVLELDGDGIARKGVIVRHLVIPGQTADSLAILHWIKKRLSPFVGLSLMSQYHPCFKAPEEIRRRLRADEYRDVMNRALHLGFENLFVQPEPFGPEDPLVPDFRLQSPFRWK